MPKNEDRREQIREQVREQVLDRLWELAKLSPEMTRNSITGQVKAIQMIVAIEGLIPDRRAASSGKKSAPPLSPVDIYQAAWLRQRQEKPDPAPAPQEQEPHPVEPEPQTTPAAAADAPPPPVMPIGPAHDRSQSVFAHLFHPPDATSSAPEAPALGSVPDTRVPLWKLRIPIARRRR
ncbi:MAG: hypothetical protein WCD57_10705 [Acidobacteriaceae bacterium]